MCLAPVPDWEDKGHINSKASVMTGITQELILKQSTPVFIMKSKTLNKRTMLKSCLFFFYFLPSNMSTF